VVAVADASPSHVDEYTRRHERQQLEKLRKEVRSFRTVRLISLNSFLSNRSKPRRRNSYAARFINTIQLELTFSQFQARLEEKHGEKPESK
jgi:hypothetical protein